MTNVQLIEKLSNAKSVPGFEGEVVEIIKSFAKDFATVEVDSMLNVYLYPKGVDMGSNTKPVVTLDAHSDEVGLLVQSIHTGGLIQIVNLGGWDPASLQAQVFHIRNDNGEYIRAVVSSIPSHFANQNTNSKPQIQTIRLDVGASSRKEVESSFRISIGAPAVPATEFHHNTINNTIMGKALDNRLGCAVTLLACKELFPQVDVLEVLPVGVISTQEELGLRGAKVSSNRINPAVAIVLEASPSDEFVAAPDVAQGVLHKGAQVRLFDPTMIAHPGLVRLVRNIGDNAGIAYQCAVRSGGGTDAGVLHVQGRGVPTVVIAVPARYIHSHNAIASMADFDSAVRLSVATVKGLSEAAVVGFHNGGYLSQ